MATVRSFNAERMLGIEASTIVDARLEGDDLILVTRGAPTEGIEPEEINIGRVTGEQGLAGTDAYVAQTPILVFYGTNLNTARPPTTRVCQWFGTGLPANAAVGDIVFSTTAIAGGGGGTTPTDPGSGFVGMLDGLQVPLRAYSLRRLSSLYTGAPIRVRRGADNVEQDIAFTSSGDLDITALQTFAGTDSVYVKTFYDQSGNGRHLSNPTATRHPRIVNAGTVETEAGKPLIRFDGSANHLYSENAGLYAAGAASLAAVVSAAASANATVFGESSTDTTNSYRMLRIGRGSVSPVLRASVIAASATIWEQNVSGTDTTFNNIRKQLFTVDDGAKYNAWVDQTQLITDAAAVRGAAPTLTRTGMGATPYTSPSGYMNGTVQELIAWGSNRASDRAFISGNQKSYWGL
jgi:hypothetical protein